MIVSIVLLFAVAFAVLIGFVVASIAIAFIVRRLLSGRVQFMESKDWKRVRTRLNESHEETQVAVATDHLRGLLAEDE